MLTQIFKTDVRDLLETIQDAERNFRMEIINDFNMEIIGDKVIYTFYVYCGDVEVHLAMSGLCYEHSMDRELSIKALIDNHKPETLELFLVTKKI